MDLAAAIGEMIQVDKYGLSFYYAGKCLSMQTRIGEEQLGLQQGDIKDVTLLCLKGGDNGPKKFMRFTRTDEPERSLTYFGDGEQYDAIQFTPKRNITFIGFSVYPAIVPF
jgi:hypothetical protein